MTNWAILSGIEGNLAAYEAVLKDLRYQPIDELYILGDIVSLDPDSDAVVQRIRSPRQGELTPQVCYGWWEEHCFQLHGLNDGIQPNGWIEPKAEDLKRLWKSVSKDSVQWLRSLDFAFFELDCLLTHGSTASVSDCLDPNTNPVTMLDRILRANANQLFCGRSGLSFNYQVQQGDITSEIVTLDNQQQSIASITPRRVVGVGNVGRVPGVAHYVIYSPNTDRLTFKTVTYRAKKGFGT
jgi:hypothetical protein